MKKYSVRPVEGVTLVDHLLFHRGIKSKVEAEKFLSPDYEKHLHDPFKMKDMEKSVTRLFQAFKGNERVVIYSDYDTDGIPAAVALHDFFKKIGFENFTNYIPHRHDEGFGLNTEAVEQFATDGVKLIITIDCGIGDLVPVKLASDLGIDVIITDHHLPRQLSLGDVISGDDLPKAFAILNPKQNDCKYPDKNLCGAGVVFKLVQAVILKLHEDKSGIKPVPKGWEKWLLDMVGIATLSDMVPLLGENRVFAHFGLTVLRKSPRIGLIKLLSKLGTDQRYITEDDVGFTIGPRINAASRMGVPMDAFKLLATKDEDEATHYAEHLDKINNERKGVVASLSKEVKKIIRDRYDGSEKKVMVIGNPLWKPALLGLVANVCANDYKCPVFLWGRDGDNVIKGSCRSGDNANLAELMSQTSPETFLQFGGHAFSGGFSVANDKIHTLEEELNRVYEAGLVPSFEVDTLVDSEITFGEVNWDFYKSIEKLAPFGTGNPKPTFIFRDIVPKEIRHFGKEKNHLEMIFEKPDGKKISALAFFKTADDLDMDVDVGKPLSLVATLEKSMYRNFPELRLRIVDVF